MAAHDKSLAAGIAPAAGPVMATSGPPSTVEKWLLQRMLRYMNDPPFRVVLWDGSEINPGRPGGDTVTVRDRGALWRVLVNPDVGFGDTFSAGRVVVDGDLPRFLADIYVHSPDLLPDGTLGRWLRRQFMRRGSSNTLEGSKEHIHHHYDIGNDFYRLWLDREMQYTCAYFPVPDLTVEQAQQAKLDHVCRKLRLKPGDVVVEAGCGWGSLALHMARRYGARVRAFNISHEQVMYARERARELNAQDRLEYVEDDYRNITGEYDAFVSVGMLEHVGVDNYRQLGRVIDGCLKADGRGLIHSIGRNRPRPMNAWTDRRIFPGAYPPTLREMMEIFEPFDFSVLDVENLRLHYARTLEHWHTRFEENVDRVRTMFDENFVRAWRLYLAGSIAAFRAGSLQLFQVVFARGRNNDLPWTRAHLYQS